MTRTPFCWPFRALLWGRLGGLASEDWGVRVCPEFGGGSGTNGARAASWACVQPGDTGDREARAAWARPQ